MRDKRRDSGEYYPGGRVIARPGTAPQQVVVQWSDVQNKPQVAPLPERYKDSDVKTKINEIASKFATVFVAAFVVWTACADVTVQKKRKDEIYNDELVVVDVTGGGVDINTNAVEQIANVAVVTNALTVATTNRVAALETATNNLTSSVSGLQSSKADAATGLTAGTKCKITYNQQGIVTAGANLSASDIPVLAASKITSGTFDIARVPSLPTSKIDSGTFPDSRIASASAWNAKPTQNDLKNATNAVAKAAKGFADNIAVVGNGFMLGTPYTAAGTEGKSFRSVGFGDGVWIAGDVAGNLLRSETGTNGWEICKSADPARRYARAIRYRDGLWTAAFRGGQVLYSMDGGTSWIQVDIGREIYDICYDPFSNDWFAAVEGGVVRCEFGDDQTFIATVTPRQVAASDDGIVVIGSAEAGSGLWYARPGETVFRHSNVTVGNFRCLTYMHGQFIAGQYGTEGGGGIWRSVDGITWEKVDSRVSTYYCCTWASGQWVMTSAYFGHIAYSANGIDWTWCDRPDSVNVVIHSCANGNGLTLFCRNADDGSSGGISVAKIGRYVRSNWFYSKDEVDAMIPPVYIPSESDPAFSNAVLKVGISTNALVVAAQLESLGTNTVAQIADFVSAFDGIGITLPQGATTLAGLLAALLAAVTWLKKTLGKVADNSGKPTDDFATDLLGKQVAISAIDARIKTNAESAAEPTNAVTLNDNAPKTVTVATATADSLAVTFGTARNGGLRICELYILNGTADTDLTFDAETVSFVSTGDSFPACEAGINYFVFAEVAANLWKVTRETLKSITTPTPVAAE